MLLADYHFFISKVLPARLAFVILRLALKAAVYHFLITEISHAVLHSAFCILHSVYALATISP